jgi:UDP-N-acetylmuramate dehydrogenase
MTLFQDLDKIVETNYELAQKTWFALGGPADFFLTPRTLEELKEVVTRCNENDIPIRVLGFGSNLLISDEGIKGAVIKLEAEQFSQVEYDGQSVTAWAGAELSKLVLNCVKQGLSGIEALTGIPGSIGGAIKMNAGGNFGDIGAAVESVTVMDSSGHIFEKTKEELRFDYRTTNITEKFILRVRLDLNTADPEQIMKTVKEIWMYKKNSQPLNTRNSGCIFKNPRGMSAGALIDRAGLKGLQIGGATVSEKHANFIVAQHGCKSKDVQRLINAIRERVKEQSGVELELEIEIWE